MKNFFFQKLYFSYFVTQKCPEIKMWINVQLLAQQNIDKMIMNTSKNKLSLPDIEYLSYNSGPIVCKSYNITWKASTNTQFFIY